MLVVLLMMGLVGVTESAPRSTLMVLATSSKPELTAAVSGSFNGPPGTNSELTWEIQISEEASATEASPHNLVQAA